MRYITIPRLPSIFYSIAKKAIFVLFVGSEFFVWSLFCNAVLGVRSNFAIICLGCFNRGSYMSAHVLLNLLNELGKRDKMRGLSSI